MRIALIAHDRMKDDLVNFVDRHKHIFAGHRLIATGTTGTKIMERTGLKVHRLMSGPLGETSKWAPWWPKNVWIW